MENQEIKPSKLKIVKDFVLNNKKKLIFVALILIGVLYLVLKPAKPKFEYITESLKKQDLSQTVSATGEVESKQLVELNFSVLGEVEKVFVIDGQTVKEGELLVTLKNQTLKSKIQEALAGVLAAQADLNRLLTGAKNEEVRLTQKKVLSAKTSLANAERDYDALVTQQTAEITSAEQQIINLEQKLKDTKAQEDLNLLNSRTSLLVAMSQGLVNANNAVDKAQELLVDLIIKDTYGTSDPTSLNEVKTINERIDKDISNARTLLSKAQVSLSNTDIVLAYNSIIEVLKTSESMLGASLRSLYATPETYSNSTSLASYKTSIKTESSNLNSATLATESSYQAWNTRIISGPININTVQYSLDDAKSRLNSLLATKTSRLASSQAIVDSAKVNVEIAQAELDLILSKASTSEISAARARILQSEAVVAQLEAEMDKYQIKAPFDGVVAKINVKANEVVREVTGSVITLLGQASFDVTVNIPESDIIKIKLENPIQITLDAFGDEDVFVGKIIQIDPAQTLIQDVVYYQVKIELDSAGKEVKQGMTANVDIITDSRKGVLSAPRRAILERESGLKYVRLLIGQTLVEKEITTGIRGDEGRIEILSGLEEGDLVVVFEKPIE